MVQLQLGGAIRGAGKRCFSKLPWLQFENESCAGRQSLPLVLVRAINANSKRPCCAGAVPTQIGLLAELTELRLDANQLTSASGKTLAVAGLRLPDYCAPQIPNSSAGAIPTEIGLLAQLVRLDLDNNQLTGASEKRT